MQAIARLVVFLGVGLAVSAGSVLAQAASENAEWKVKVTVNDTNRSGFDVEIVEGLDELEVNLIPRDGVLHLLIECGEDVPCDKLEVQIVTIIGNDEAEPLPVEGTPPESGKREFSHPAEEIAEGEGTLNSLEIIVPGEADEPKVIARYSLERGGEEGEKKPPTPPRSLGLPEGEIPNEAELLRVARSCVLEEWEPEAGPAYYDRKLNRATFFVMPFGNVLARPPAWIDENDEVEIQVLASTSLQPVLKVARSSGTRTLGELRILGSALLDSLGTIGQQAGGGEEPETEGKPIVCRWLNYRLQDFSPGEGRVTISGVTTAGDKTLGTVTFTVNPLYDGAFSFGPIWTRLSSPSFSLVPQGEDQIISQSIEGDRSLLALMYTGFVFGRRDPEKPVERGHLLENLGITIGVIPDDIANNALAGFTLDLPGGVYLNAGWHAGKVKKLDTAAKSGDKPLEMGSVFDGQLGDIPTVEEWKAKFFWGVTVDLRAALGLVRTAITGAAGG